MMSAHKGPGVQIFGEPFYAVFGVAASAFLGAAAVNYLFGGGGSVAAFLEIAAAFGFGALVDLLGRKRHSRGPGR